MSGDLLLCRCEGVTLADVRRAVAEGARGAGEVKARTRCGMGICQGRSCRALIAAVTAALVRGDEDADAGTLSYRPPVRPVSLEDLAEAADAGGARGEDEADAH